MAYWSLVILLAILFCGIGDVQARVFSVGGLKSAVLAPRRGVATEGPVTAVLRGGAAMKVDKKGKLKPTQHGFVTKVQEQLAQIKPATRAYLFATLLCTLVHVTGLPAPVLFSLDSSKLYEVWRPITAVSYLGGPSMSLANSLYFLLRYGQTLENANGTGAHAWFLIVQTTILTALGLLLGFPFQGQAMIAAIVYVCSRVNPMEKLPFQFGIVITAWQLPFAMMIIDCLSQQTVSAAWPHVLGIFSGHLYHFFTEVWPSLGGRTYLAPPQWILNKLGGRPSSNIPGFDFRKAKQQQQEEGSASSLNRSRRSKSGLFGSNAKGRKL